MKVIAHALVIASAVAMAACSQQNSAEQAIAPPAASAIIPAVKHQDPAAAASAATAPEDAPHELRFSELLKRPGFVAAFEALPGVKDLPAWVGQERNVSAVWSGAVEDEEMLIVGFCDPDDCSSASFTLLYDEKTRGIWGMFRQRQGGCWQVNWLGQPQGSRTSALAEFTADDTNRPCINMSDLQKQANFAAAFKALAKTTRLPSWTSSGGTSAAAEEMEVAGRGLLTVESCAPHDCGTERLVLVYDEQSHAMWGVFARARSDQPEASEGNDELTWLGKPGEQIRAVLKQRLYERD